MELLIGGAQRILIGLLPGLVEPLHNPPSNRIQPFGGGLLHGGPSLLLRIDVNLQRLRGGLRLGGSLIHRRLLLHGRHPEQGHHLIR